MAPHLSPQLREYIVKWRLEYGYRVSDIAKIARCSKSTVYSILVLHRLHGQTKNPYARVRGSGRFFTPEHLDYIEAQYKVNPALLLDQLQDRVYAEFGVLASINLLSLTLHRLHLTRKLFTKQAAERNDTLRAAWRLNMADTLPHQWVFLDESGVEAGDFVQKYGRSKRGQACVRRQSFFRGDRISVLPALSLDGILALDLLEGGVDRERFVRFIAEELVRAAVHD